MRTQHTHHSLPAFPVWSAGFVSDTRLVLGGGGGTGRSGVKNALVSCGRSNVVVQKSSDCCSFMYEMVLCGIRWNLVVQRLYGVEEGGNKIELLHESLLEKDEDAPMTLAVNSEVRMEINIPLYCHMSVFLVQDDSLVCGVNSSTESIQKGVNEHCRLYKLKENELGFIINPFVLLLLTGNLLAGYQRRRNRSIQPRMSKCTRWSLKFCQLQVLLTKSGESDRYCVFSGSLVSGCWDHRQRGLYTFKVLHNTVSQSPSLGQVSIISYPSLVTIAAPFQIPKGKLYTLDFSETTASFFAQMH